MRRGEPSEDPEFALRDLQYHSKLGRTTNLKQFQSQDEENHKKIRTPHLRTCSIIQKWEGPQTWISFNLKKRRTIRRPGSDTLGLAESYKNRMGRTLIQVQRILERGYQELAGPKWINRSSLERKSLMSSITRAKKSR